VSLVANPGHLFKNGVSSVHLDSHLPPSVYLSFLFWSIQTLFYPSILSSLFSFSHASPYIFFLPSFRSFAAIRKKKKPKSRQNPILNPFVSIQFIINLVSVVCCLSVLCFLKSLPTPLADSEFCISSFSEQNYICRGLCQEDVPCQKVLCG